MYICNNISASLSLKPESAPGRTLSCLEIRLEDEGKDEGGKMLPSNRLFENGEPGTILLRIPIPLEIGWELNGPSKNGNHLCLHFSPKKENDLPVFQNACINVRIVEKRELPADSLNDGKNSISTDNDFFLKVCDQIERNLSDPQFNVARLCRNLRVTRSHLYRKTVAVTGESPIRLILKFRLNHAARLLENKTATVSEVAEQVGFSNYSYFSRSFKQTFNQLPSQYGGGVNIFNSADEKFLCDVTRMISENISSPKFNVGVLSQKLLIGRTTLYRRLINLTGQTPASFIRTQRLKRARQLLNSETRSIISVAFEVGFCSASYFSRCFKQEYGCLPSEYKTEEQNKRRKNGEKEE